MSRRLKPLREKESNGSSGSASDVGRMCGGSHESSSGDSWEGRGERNVYGCRPAECGDFCLLGGSGEHERQQRLKLLNNKK